jgi:hypothetical protein
MEFFRRLLGLTKKTLYTNEVDSFLIDSQRYEKGITTDGKRYDTAVFELDETFPSAHVVFRSSSRWACRKLHRRICEAIRTGEGVKELNALVVYGTNLLNIKPKDKRRKKKNVKQKSKVSSHRSRNRGRKGQRAHS